MSRFSGFNLGCNWETESGFIGVFASADEFGVFSDVFIVDGEDQYNGFPVGPVTLTTEAFEASYDFFATDEGGDPIGSATASATLTPGGRINERFVFGNGKVHIVGREYLVEGSLTVTLEGPTTVLAMDETSCSAGDVTQRSTSRPAGAEGSTAAERQAPRARCRSRSVTPSQCARTRGGFRTRSPVHSRRRKATSSCRSVTPPGGPSPAPGPTSPWTPPGATPIRSLACTWTMPGAHGTQVGSGNDNVDSLQARLAVPTEAGVTYYVQVGGFGGESGTLVLTVE